jgi:hypothetical protein
LIKELSTGGTGLDSTGCCNLILMEGCAHAWTPIDPG